MKTPSKKAIKEAKNVPNGYVYEIDNSFERQEIIPREAIIGAWKVDKNGIIIGEFIPNQNYVDLKNL